MSVSEAPTTVTSGAAPVEATPAEGAAPDATLPVPDEVAAPQETTPDEPAKKAWATIDGTDYEDDYGAYESEKFAPHRERDARRIEERLTQDYDTKLASSTKSWESTQLNQQLQGFIGRLGQQIADGEIEVADKTFARLEALAQPYQEVYAQQKQAEGAQQAAGMLYREVLELAPSRRARDELEDFSLNAFRKDGEKAWPTVLKQLLKTATAEPARAEYERGVKDGRSAAVEETKAESRNGQGPDNARASGGSGYATLAEAQAAHARHEITNDQMRAERSRFLAPR